MIIKLFITGGTIDCERIKEKDKYIFEKTHLPEMLNQSRCKIDIDSQVLMKIGKKFCRIEGLLPVTKQEIENAAKELKELVQKFCGGNITYQILDDKHFETDL